ncbi:MAG: hypothetical protein GY866_33490 [Proteobacteria bacterium]|nr:hypothetical protein [Pseudomonadota bacterium]
MRPIWVFDSDPSVEFQPHFSASSTTYTTAFYKVDENGNVTEALEGECDNAEEMSEDSSVQCVKSGMAVELPQVKNVAINGQDVDFLFTRSFIYRDIVDDGEFCNDPCPWEVPRGTRGPDVSRIEGLKDELEKVRPSVRNREVR